MRYILSQQSQEDIETIYEFGLHQFGTSQALDYLIELRDHFELLATNPEIGKRRNEIKHGLYSLPYASHIIFYRILENQIRIVRVLHGSRDLRKFKIID